MSTTMTGQQALWSSERYWLTREQGEDRARDPRFWFDKYQTTGPGTLGYWVYLAACYCVNGSEEQCLAIGKIALETGCGIWHAAWVYGGQKGECSCTPCTRVREVK